MITRIILENYMAHRRSEFALAPGLTVLVGPNNCGKSAVVAALETIVSNASGDYMVRHGEKECRVTVETDDGHTVVWQRVSKTTSYIVDGTPIGRLRKSVPDEARAALRLGPVAAGENADEIDVHIGKQKAPIFEVLTDEPRAASFFASSSDAEKLVRMQELHRTRVREANARKKALDAECAALQLKADALAGLDSAAQHVAELEREHREAAAGAQLLAASEKQLAALDAAARETEIATARSRSLASLSAPPKLAETALLEVLLGQLARESARAAAEQARSAAAAGLQAAPDLAPTANIEQLLAHLAAESRLASRLASESGRLSALAEPAALSDTAPLERMAESLLQAHAAATASQARRRTLAALAESTALADAAPLAAAIAALEAAAAECTRHAAAQGAIESELAAAAAAGRAFTAEHPHCPLCGAMLDADRWVSSEHLHG